MQWELIRLSHSHQESKGSRVTNSDSPEPIPVSGNAILSEDFRAGNMKPIVVNNYIDQSAVFEFNKDARTLSFAGIVPDDLNEPGACDKNKN